MAWINDVVPQAKIRSSWGNAVRDHVVQTFISVAERDANAVPRTNMMAWTANEKTLWLYDGATWRILTEPWQDLPLGAFQINIAGGPAVTASAGHLQMRHFDGDWTECRARVSITGATAGTAGQPLTIFPAAGYFSMDGTYEEIIGQAKLYDGATGLQLGGMFIVSSGPQSGGYLIQSGSGLITVASGAATNTTWSGAAGSTVSFHLRGTYP